MIPGAQLPHLAECRTCHEPIRFVRMVYTGRAMPVNPRPLNAPVGHGTVAARLHGPALLGYVLSADHPRDDRHPYLFTPHWKTCTEPAKRTPPPTPEPEALF